MATVIRCDGGCGAESPDPEKGLHVANQWMNLLVNAKNSRRGWLRFRLCQNCADKLALPSAPGEYVPTSGFASGVLGKD